MLHGKRGSLPRIEVQASRLESGAIPTAMQWKKAAVFAVASPAKAQFLDWLKQLPDGLETVNPGKFSDETGALPSLFVLYGWSTSGADELRRAAVDSVILAGHQVNVYISRPYVETDASFMGTADMRFVGWEIPLSKLEAGEYQALLQIRRDTIKITGKPPFREEKVAGKGYEKMSELQFRMPEWTNQ